MDQARVVPVHDGDSRRLPARLSVKTTVSLYRRLPTIPKFLAVENAGGVIREVPLNEKNIVTAEATAQKIEEVKAETGKLPVLVMIDHFDYQLANEHEIAGIGKVSPPV